MEIVEQIGSYAGLAAIVGLAVLSALYFSQARDLRRLREAQQEAAPRRLSEQLAQRRAAQQRQAAAGRQRTAQPAGAARPAHGTQARPAPLAQPAAAQTQARPVQAEGAAAAGSAAAAAATPATKAPPATKEPAGNGEAGSQVPAPQPAPAGNSSPRPAAPKLPAPPRRPPAATGAPPTPTSGRTAPWYRRLPARYVALIAGGVLVVGGGAAFAIALIADDGSRTSQVVRQTTPPLDPSTITVSVLNGTDVPGLAAQVADTVEDAGFQRGNVANAPTAASAESAVLYADGARRAARQVGQELDITQVEPMDPDSETTAGNADVAVVVGRDQAQ